MLSDYFGATKPRGPTRRKSVPSLSWWPCWAFSETRQHCHLWRAHVSFFFGMCAAWGQSPFQALPQSGWDKNWPSLSPPLAHLSSWQQCGHSWHGIIHFSKPLPKLLRQRFLHDKGFLGALLSQRLECWHPAVLGVCGPMLERSLHQSCMFQKIKWWATPSAPTGECLASMRPNSDCQSSFVLASASIKKV